jgi:hypothetical protein
MFKNPFENYLITRDNFFASPDKIVDLSLKQEYFCESSFPGLRTKNLLDSTDTDTRNFAFYFANRIRADVFPGIQKFHIDIRFHKNKVYDIDDANIGWIHSDPSDLAGLVYLNKDEFNFLNGTSIFLKKNKEEFINKDFESRIKFNLYDDISDNYLHEIKENWKNFDETIRVGNCFNRLVAYDATMYHRPNNYKINTDGLRKTLLFFIRGFSFLPTFDDSKFIWKDS